MKPNNHNEEAFSIDIGQVSTDRLECTNLLQNQQGCKWHKAWASTEMLSLPIATDNLIQKGIFKDGYGNCSSAMWLGHSTHLEVNT